MGSEMCIRDSRLRTSGPSKNSASRIRTMSLCVMLAIAGVFRRSWDRTWTLGRVIEDVRSERETSMEILETKLPGVSIRYEFEFEFAAGPTLGVIAHRDGRRELIRYNEVDPDACSISLLLTDRESVAMIELLGGSESFPGPGPDFRSISSRLSTSRLILRNIDCVARCRALAG